jgi:hypothetical protein
MPFRRLGATFAPATKPTLQSELQQAFDAGRQTFYDLQDDNAFLDLLASRHIPAQATDQPDYWETLADYSAAVSQQARRSDSTGSADRQIVINELLAATPDFITKSLVLGANRHLADRQEAIHDVRIVSYYNSLLRDTASAWPDITAGRLGQQLAGIANTSLRDRRTKRRAAAIINSAIHGAQHEVAFGQLLEHSGWQFRPADLKQDIGGVDYVATSRDGKHRWIDVKASLHDILKHGGNAQRPYVAKHDDRLVMYSLLTDEELDDTFHVPEVVAIRKGKTLGRLLFQAHSRHHQTA